MKMKTSSPKRCGVVIFVAWHSVWVPVIPHTEPAILVPPTMPSFEDMRPAFKVSPPLHHSSFPVCLTFVEKKRVAQHDQSGHVVLLVRLLALLAIALPIWEKAQFLVACTQRRVSKACLVLSWRYICSVSCLLLDCCCFAWTAVSFCL